MFKDACCAIPGGTFLVAGDQERDRTARGASGLASGDGGDECGDGPFHIDSPAAEQPTVFDCPRERFMLPVLAGRDHVGMPGEGEMRGCGAAAGDQIGDRTELLTFHREAEGSERLRDDRLSAFVMRGDGRASDQGLGER